MIRRLKGLTIDHPYDWAFQTGFPHDVVLSVIESELSSIIAAADRVILVEKPHRCLLNFEFMASHDLTIIERLLKYGSLLIERYRLPVHQIRNPATGGRLAEVQRRSCMALALWQCRVVAGL